MRTAVATIRPAGPQLSGVAHAEPRGSREEGVAVMWPMDDEAMAQ